ncbi:efflux RND transporter periplasmic adaptor subunit [Pseudophaeobacter sp. EL27]|uniref:efflux RND transporter periplasmic adaptor subunit n=1 Tax=Pseudophaeobacter sp. EL27 TaxID=2107580 RepID=UPI000EFAC4E9|nr:efflux RND transporter periplasmic adaptor subunit [Pseudophaeobacter sp. EL27]
MFRVSLILGCLLLLGCKEEDVQTDEVIRGLKVHTVEATESSNIRRFPAVLEPSELNTLSFETGGALSAIDLNVGQRIAKGEVIARLDETSLVLQVETAKAAVSQSEAAARNALETSARQAELLERGSTTRVAADDAKAAADQAEAVLLQSQTSLEVAQENLSKAVLTAHMDGIINSVDVTSYSNVAAGASIITLYPADSFEVFFSVNFDTVSQLVVGKRAEIRLADRPDIVLPAVISEIGSRAGAVSSFPIVLELTQENPLLKAGMAVEASIELPLPEAEGFLVPLSAIIKDGGGNTNIQDAEVSKAGVYLFDPDSSTVVRRDVSVAGIRENSVIVIDGLDAGDLVASAGVSFLKEGQKVNLLTAEEN